MSHLGSEIACEKYLLQRAQILPPNPYHRLTLLERACVRLYSRVLPILAHAELVKLEHH
jgi:hypothetical protein